MLMKHCRKVKGEQVITPQMAQQLKTKNINVVNFAVIVKLNFCYRQTHCIDDQDNIQSVTDTDNEFNKCQTPRKKLQSFGISPVSLHAFMKTLRYFGSMQSTSWLFENSESDSYGKNMKEKVNDSVRLHKAMQEKLKTATYSEQIQIRTLVPGLDELFRIF